MPYECRPGYPRGWRRPGTDLNWPAIRTFLRFRADSRINAVIREVAGAHEAAGVRLADAEQALAQGDPHSTGIPGADLFYEHVHLTFDGNYLLARAVFDQVCAALPQLASKDRQGALPSRRRCAELLALTAWDESKAAADMVDLTFRKTIRQPVRPRPPPDRGTSTKGRPPPAGCDARSQRHGLADLRVGARQGA